MSSYQAETERRGTEEQDVEARTRGEMRRRRDAEFKAPKRKLEREQFREQRGG